MPNTEARKLFPRILRSYMNRDRLSQKDVAAHVGVSNATVSEWINGKKFPRVDKMQLLSELFGIRMSDLYSPSEPSVPSLRDPGFYVFSDDEMKLVLAYRAADDRARADALSTLLNHPMK